MIARARKKETTKMASRKKKLFWLFFFPIILSLLGVVFVFEASSVRSFTEFNDSFHYFRNQSIFVVAGICVMAFFSFFDYHKLYFMAFIFMIATIVLLCLVLIPGIGQTGGGARSWIDLGFFNMQPTEFAKFSVIIYLASWFNFKERKRFFSFLILLGILMFLIILQPDMGTATIVFLLSIMIYFLAGIDLHYLLFLLPIGSVAFWALVKVSPYRWRRIQAFFDPTVQTESVSYHINQIMIAFSNGGLFGKGFGSSRQKYLFLPEAHTDSIFAIIGEEMGFIGGVILIGMLIILLYKIYEVAMTAPDRYGKLLAGGILGYFGLQIVVNLAGMVNLFPLTGIPLPFISYGGSNLLTSFAFIGILINISRKSKI